MDRQIFLVILFMGLATYITRMLPLFLMAQRNLPKSLIQWLKYIPVAVLASLLGPALLVKDGELAFNLQNYYLWGALPAFLVAWRTKQMLPTVLVGMVVVALLRLLN